MESVLPVSTPPGSDTPDSNMFPNMLWKNRSVLLTRRLASSKKNQGSCVYSKSRSSFALHLCSTWKVFRHQ